MRLLTKGHAKCHTALGGLVDVLWHDAPVHTGATQALRQRTNFQVDVRGVPLHGQLGVATPDLQERDAVPHRRRPVILLRRRVCFHGSLPLQDLLLNLETRLQPAPFRLLGQQTVIGCAESAWMRMAAVVQGSRETGAKPGLCLLKLVVCNPPCTDAYCTNKDMAEQAPHSR